jgi:hypothetical protein
MNRFINFRFLAVGLGCLFFIASVGMCASQALTPLPQGPGLAQRYVNDSGITADSTVVFADNFESYTQASDLWRNWDNVFQMYCTRIAQEPGNVFSGSKALEFTLPKQSIELSNAVQKVLSKQRDILFLRYYAKFDNTFDIVGSCHNGGGISAHYFVNGNATPGIPANGYNKFLIEFECWRGETGTANPGQYNVYIYHPAQRSNYGDHFFPNGEVMPNTSLPFNFGPDFVSRPNVIPQLGRWYCHEVMLKANTVGQHDGRIACWLDGVLIADFPNLSLRDVDSLKIDRFNVSLHAGSNPICVTKKWYDNIVAATSYIGPMNTGAGVKGDQRRHRGNGGQKSGQGLSGPNTKVYDIAGHRITASLTGCKNRSGIGSNLPNGIYIINGDSRTKTILINSIQ